MEEKQTWRQWWVRQTPDERRLLLVIVGVVIAVGVAAVVASVALTSRGDEAGAPLSYSSPAPLTVEGGEGGEPSSDEAEAQFDGVATDADLLNSFCNPRGLSRAEQDENDYLCEVWRVRLNNGITALCTWDKYEDEDDVVRCTRE